MHPLNKLVVIGTGLIGGSFALALRKAGLVHRVVGVGRRPETVLRAQQLGIVDAVGGYDAATSAKPIWCCWPCRSARCSR